MFNRLAYSFNQDCTRLVGNLKRWSSSSTEGNHQKKSQNEEQRKKEMMGRNLPKQKPISGVKDILLVASGKGGVGKSTTAVNIALGLKEVMKKNIGLLDADIFGPSIPKLMNIQQKPEINADKKMIPPVNHGIPCMSMGFLIKQDAPVVWRGLMVMQAVQQLLWKVDWGALDLLVVDMPPGTGDVPLSIVQNVPVTGVVLVTTPQDVALMDVRRGAEMFRKMNVPVLGIVKNMSLFCCPNCGQETPVFGKGKVETLANAMNVEILGDVPLHQDICDDSDAGTPIVSSRIDSKEAKIFIEISEKISRNLLSLKNKHTS